MDGERMAKIARMSEFSGPYRYLWPVMRSVPPSSETRVGIERRVETTASRTTSGSSIPCDHPLAHAQGGAAYPVDVHLPDVVVARELGAVGDRGGRAADHASVSGVADEEKDRTDTARVRAVSEWSGRDIILLEGRVFHDRGDNHILAAGGSAHVDGDLNLVGELVEQDQVRSLHQVGEHVASDSRRSCP